MHVFINKACHHGHCCNHGHGCEAMHVCSFVFMNKACNHGHCCEVMNVCSFVFMNKVHDDGVRVCKNIWAQDRHNAIADVIIVKLFMTGSLKLERLFNFF